MYRFAHGRVPCLAVAREDADMDSHHRDNSSNGIERSDNDEAVRISNWTLATGRPPVRGL
jgi:hypothetical protein